uniref:WD repeat-containing protein 20 n=1 Tax=Eptatretus burgeri TaxID=7764 RepID=A0A8C4QCZ4_EPTBU
MAAPPPGPAPIDVDVKTQFSTREGTYRLLAPSEYSRPNRVPLSTQASNPVRVSFANVDDHSDSGERICFNVGRELYFYIYKGTMWWIICHVYFMGDLTFAMSTRLFCNKQQLFCA